jgi:hypothetical protein
VIRTIEMPSQPPQADLYVSVDIEADGPIPGRYSMLALGMCVAGRFDGEHFEARDPTAQTFYRELQPISDQVDAPALAVARLDRDRLSREGVTPQQAMHDAAEWLTAVSGDDRPIVCAFPAAFDWSFVWWYMVTYGPSKPPLTFSSCLDMKTMFATSGRRVFSKSGKSSLPPELRSRRTHTHHALDDAIEQADTFARLFTWHG